MNHQAKGLHTELLNGLKIVDYEAIHVDGLLSVLSKVRDAYPVYPPPASAGDTDESFERWLQSDEGLARRVALSDGRIVGHGMLSEPHGYILDCLEASGIQTAPATLAEIGKLFVSPSISHGGTGTALIRELVRAAEAHGRIPVSCILEDSPESLRLHGKLGFEIIASFEGVSGLNHILTLG